MIIKDFRFLLIASLGTIFLTAFNYPLVIKSLSSSKLANTQIKQAARQINIQDSRKTETEFWNSIKEIDFDDISQNNQTTKKPELSETAEKPKSQFTEVKKQEKPLTKFLLVGDSIMYDFGIQFNNAAKKSNYKFDQIKVDSRPSTGLNRIDYFDWYGKTTQLISKYNPEAMVVLFGGNDDQGILDTEGKYRNPLSPEWKAAYRERVERYAKLINQSSVRKAYWIGHPTSSVARYRKFFLMANKIYQEVSDTYPKMEFVENWDAFAVNGNYAPIIANKSGKKGRVRTKDGYHFTSHGASIVVENLMDKMEQYGVLQEKVE